MRTMRPPRPPSLLALGAAMVTACASNLPRTVDPMPARGWVAADSASAHAAATRFLAAFDAMEWQTFASFLDEEVTVFLPFSSAPARVDGRPAVEEAFRRFFASVQGGGRNALGIMPNALRVQLAGPEVAVVSFELGNVMPSRRSLVFSRSGRADWKVVHWHASPPPQAPVAAAAGLALPPERLASYEGIYDLQLAGRTLEVRVRAEAGRLMVQFAGRTSPLSYRGDQEFVLESDSSFRFVFTNVGNTATGLTLHQGGAVFHGSRRP